MTIQMFGCVSCSAEFDTFAALEQHVHYAHPEFAAKTHSYRCVTCDKQFVEGVELGLHIAEHRHG